VDRILTIPNGISAARLVGVPVFLWLVLGPRTAVADDWAVGLLIVAGLSDWLDGKIARALNQASRLGQVLDPAADRLYIVSTIGAALGVLRRRAGFGTLQVSLAGKGATLCLLYAFPLLFLGDHPGWGGTLARVIGWAFATWGTVLYWWAAMLYLAQVRSLVGGYASPHSGGAGP